MKDLIDRQAAIDALEREKTYCNAFSEKYAHINVFEQYNDGLTDGIKALKKIPSAQQELIRCKDCKHRPIATKADEGIYWGSSLAYPDYICPMACDDPWYNQYPEDDFYCGKANRKEDKEDD